MERPHDYALDRSLSVTQELTSLLHYLFSRDPYLSLLDALRRIQQDQYASEMAHVARHMICFLENGDKPREAFAALPTYFGRDYILTLRTAQDNKQLAAAFKRLDQSLSAILAGQNVLER